MRRRRLVAIRQDWPHQSQINGSEYVEEAESRLLTLSLKLPNDNTCSNSNSQKASSVIYRSIRVKEQAATLYYISATIEHLRGTDS